ncbi:MAG: FtsQ-type POTRA domain-containing protein [Anaerolineaceae bacterium]|jgi:hypothetical protein|nr:MAG: FtsQ-type POTRA domain-containing protein [Anaerolineaceae bacterium]
MKRKNRAESVKRSDLLRQKRQEKQNEWLHTVDSRAEHIAARPASEAYEENQRDFRPLKGEQNPLAHIAIDNKDYTTPKLHLSWRFLSAAIALASSFLLISAWRSADYRVSDIEVEGINRVTKEEITSILNIDQQRIFMLSPLTLEQAINENFPELYNVRVSLSFPAKVTVHVEEREPYLTWNYQGKNLWIDAEGYLLPGRGSADVSLTIDSNEQPPFYIPEESIILQGEKRLRKTVIAKGDDDYLALFKIYQKIDPVTYQAIKELNQLLPEQGIILYDARRGLGWNDSRGFQVYVGSDLQDITAKMNMIEEIVKTLTKANIQPTLISVEQINAPYYRLD